MAETDPKQWASISFSTLISKYITIQSKVVSMVKSVGSQMSHATPGQFLMLQFYMSQVTQVGESISNLVSQVNSMINNTIRNQKTQ